MMMSLKWSEDVAKAVKVRVCKQGLRIDIWANSIDRGSEDQVEVSAKIVPCLRKYPAG